MRRYLVVGLFLVAAVALWFVYDQTKLPPGVESKGAADIIPWVSLAGSLASLATAAITFLLKLRELRPPNQRPS